MANAIVAINLFLVIRTDLHWISQIKKGRGTCVQGCIGKMLYTTCRVVSPAMWGMSAFNIIISILHRPNMLRNLKQGMLFALLPVFPLNSAAESSAPFTTDMIFGWRLVYCCCCCCYCCKAAWKRWLCKGVVKGIKELTLQLTWSFIIVACVAAVSFPFPNAREREENCERVAK